MVDPRFFKIMGPFSLANLAALLNAQLLRGEEHLLFHGVATLQEATPQEIAVFHNLKYQKDLASTRAGAIILTAEMAPQAPLQAALLVCDTPLKQLGRLLEIFYGEKASQKQEEGGIIDPRAALHPKAQLSSGCSIGAYAVVEEGAVLGEGCSIGAYSYIGKGVSIGEGTHVGHHVTLTHAIVGHHVQIKPGARIGQRGFGFFMDDASGTHETQLHLGRVVIGNHVEIGSNTTIDRGSLRDTVIEDHVRIDNLVQIAHNVRVGRGAVLVAQVGIAGSTRVGERSILAGQVGVAGHLCIGAGVKIAAKSGVMHSLEEGGAFGGIPAVPIQDWRRQSVLLRKMSRKGSSPK